MIHFDPQFFRKFDPTPDQIERYLAGAWRDFEIAKKDDFWEVKFAYSYQALIKGGIALLAQAGSVKVRSVPGHHVKILEKMSDILKDPDINVIGNAMRTKRNLDLYEGGTTIGEHEIEEFIRFVETVLDSVQRHLKSK